MKILITGASGFVGLNLKKSLNENYTIVPKSYRYKEKQKIKVSEEIIVHLSGKAHDLKKTSNSKDYLDSNFELTKQIYDGFLASKTSETFIFISSVKAVADSVLGVLKEEVVPNPKTNYGISKLAAENYILSKKPPKNKRFFILRPCMIHGPKNKGNLNLMYTIVKKKVPWPLGSFENKRSFLSIDNFNFVIKEIIKNKSITSGIFNLADDASLSTNSLVNLISSTLNFKARIWHIPKSVINFIAIVGDFIKLPINSERLQKLTENYEVSNKKIKSVLKKELPISTKQGLINTFKSFNEK